MSRHAQNPHSTALSVLDEAQGNYAFIKDIDHYARLMAVDRGQRLSFAVNDIPFHVTHVLGHGESRICIQAMLGYMPFSIENAERRRALQMILAATWALPHVRFGIDINGRIFAAGRFEDDMLLSPDCVFVPLAQFLQEARPFLDLIGQYL